MEFTIPVRERGDRPSNCSGSMSSRFDLPIRPSQEFPMDSQQVTGLPLRVDPAEQQVSIYDPEALLPVLAGSVGSFTNGMSMTLPIRSQDSVPTRCVGSFTNGISMMLPIRGQIPMTVAIPEPFTSVPEMRRGSIFNDAHGVHDLEYEQDHEPSWYVDRLHEAITHYMNGDRGQVLVIGFPLARCKKLNFANQCQIRFLIGEACAFEKAWVLAEWFLRACKASCSVILAGASWDGFETLECFRVMLAEVEKLLVVVERKAIEDQLAEMEDEVEYDNIDDERRDAEMFFDECEDDEEGNSDEEDCTQCAEREMIGYESGGDDELRDDHENEDRASDTSSLTNLDGQFSECSDCEDNEQARTLFEAKDEDDVEMQDFADDGASSEDEDADDDDDSDFHEDDNNNDLDLEAEEECLGTKLAKVSVKKEELDQWAWWYKRRGIPFDGYATLDGH